MRAVTEKVIPVQLPLQPAQVPLQLVRGSTPTNGSVAPTTGWANIKMGGGGYVPGIINHPTVANLRYARTDARIVADTSVYGRVFLSGRGMNYNY